MFLSKVGSFTNGGTRPRGYGFLFLGLAMACITIYYKCTTSFIRG